eukprot:scaffold299_cov343-Prasinococcus_capsulatus_cf.AAC.8
MEPLVKGGGSQISRTLMLQLIIFETTASAAQLGEGTAVAAHQVVIQLWWLSLFSLDSLAVAAQGLVGTSIGQDQKTQARVVTNRILGWGLLAGTTAALVLGVGGSAVPQLFTEDVGVQDASMAPIMLIALLQPLNALVFVGDGVFQGAGDFGYLAVAMAGAVGPSLLVLSSLGGRLLLAKETRPRDWA